MLHVTLHSARFIRNTQLGPINFEQEELVVLMKWLPLCNVFVMSHKIAKKMIFGLLLTLLPVSLEL